MPNGNSGTKTVLAFGDGSSLVSSPGGDLYWFINPDGTSTPCSLQQASWYWQQYEQYCQAGPKVPDQQGPDHGGPPAIFVPDQEEQDRSARTVMSQQGGTQYSPWQRELLDRLGLTESDLDSPEPQSKRKK